jgi:tRNA dimethylallyltransferase
VELVSVDSMAVYRGMDIGTVKPSAAERAELSVHLVDLVAPSEEFTVQAFQAEGRRALEGIAGRGHAALLVGGTGLYLRSLVDDLNFPGRFPEVAAELEEVVASAGPRGSEQEESVLVRLHGRLAALDPTAAARIAPANRRRLVRALEVSIGSGRPFSSFGPGLERYPPTAVTLVGVDRPPDELDRRIARRFTHLMDSGLLDEVKALASAPGGLSRTARQALGYRELLGHLERGVPLEEAVQEAVRRTRVFARRQRAWFRRDPRIVWVDPDDDPEGSIATLFGDLTADQVAVGDCASDR